MKDGFLKVSLLSALAADVDTNFLQSHDSAKINWHSECHSSLPE